MCRMLFNTLVLEWWWRRLLIKTIALCLEPVELLHHRVVIGPPTTCGFLNARNVLHIVVNIGVHGREEVSRGHGGE